MKFVDEFRDKKIVKQILRQIHGQAQGEYRFMEVCGGHTMAIHKFGIPSLLPEHVRLLSGPGCPVCVTDRRYIDHAIALGRLDNFIITTFGDLIRVPGSSSSLELEKSKGRDVRIVYSILDALKIAEANPEKKVVFLGIGFETTAPGTASGILMASEKKLRNFFVLSAHKVMPPAMKALIDEGVKIDGYIAPGHVSTITGSTIYNDIAEKYKLGCVISGFEPVDLLQSILMLVRQVNAHNPKVEIQYKRAVIESGNQKALAMMKEVFEPRDDWWRGFGILPESGLGINEKYTHFDAEKMINVEIEATRENKGCLCGEVLKGLVSPLSCPLFKKVCTPSNPVGACMVSNEGACHAFFKYNMD